MGKKMSEEGNGQTAHVWTLWKAATHGVLNRMTGKKQTGIAVVGLVPARLRYEGEAHPRDRSIEDQKTTPA
jgi:hypothetical protein